jgi:hypothetical protein
VKNKFSEKSSKNKEGNVERPERKMKKAKARFVGGKGTKGTLRGTENVKKEK